MQNRIEPVAVPLVLEYLYTHTYGITYRELIDKLQEKASAQAISDALGYAVDAGEVRYMYRPAPAPAEAEAVPDRALDLLFYSTNNLLLPVASYDEVNQVVSYFADREDYGRFGGGPTVTLEIAAVFRGLEKELSAPKVAHALDTLRKEGVLWFEAREKNGYMTVTLRAKRKFTVIAMEKTYPAYYGAAPSFGLRCFHVRAGSADLACEKVSQVLVEEGMLIVQAIVEDFAPFEAAPGLPALNITRL